VLGRALYALYVQIIRLEASTLMRAPAVLLGHVDRIERSLAKAEGLRLRAARAVDQIERSLHAWRQIGRSTSRAATATKALLGSASSLRKMLGS
jgi:hypothetical protein